MPQKGGQLLPRPSWVARPRPTGPNVCEARETLGMSVPGTDRFEGRGEHGASARTHELKLLDRGEVDGDLPSPGFVASTQNRVADVDVRPNAGGDPNLEPAPITHAGLRRHHDPGGLPFVAEHCSSAAVRSLERSRGEKRTLALAQRRAVLLRELSIVARGHEYRPSTERACYNYGGRRKADPP